MATLLIRNLPEGVKEALRQRAATNGRSMEEEARTILSLEMRRDRSVHKGLGTQLVEIFKGLGPLEIPPRTGKMRKPPFLTDEEWGE